MFRTVLLRGFFFFLVFHILSICEMCIKIRRRSVTSFYFEQRKDKRLRVR